MESNINKRLDELGALPSQQNWAELVEPFRTQYRAYEVCLNDPDNNTEEQLTKMDNDLCELLDQLYYFEIVPDPIITDSKDEPAGASIEQPIVENVETTQALSNEPEKENNDDMKKQKSKGKTKSPILETDKVQEPIEMEKGGQIENPVIAETHGHASQSQPDETNQNIESSAGATEKSTDIESSVEQPPAFNNLQQQPVQNSFPEFLAFAQVQETVSAKDLVKFKIPDAYWKINKPEFVIGNVRFKKTVAGLIFNRWEVIKS